MTQTPPLRITAADVAAAATRLLGTLVLDLATMTIGPATYLPRLAAFATIDGQELGPDDGSLIVIPGAEPGRVQDLIAEHGTPGRAAQALARTVRAERLA
jgi:hypothetical protein